MNLIIVESPTKATTIKKFLKDKYNVLASYGHIRDLPKSELGVDIENNFEPKYIIPKKSRKTISELKKAAEKSKNIIIATDEDREGESIAWHIKEVLKLEDYQRIVFHEITPKAIENAIKNPRKIDMNLVNAQQARRILDRLVGYKLSPFLWKKITKGLSAGRVQSVAVRLITEREVDIKNFLPQEYWTISAFLLKIKNEDEKDNKEIESLLYKKNNKTIEKLDIKNEKQVKEILNDLKNAEYKIKNISKKEIKKNPLPPFITSTLQQECWQKFKWPSKLTMSLAQQLYEKGLITYHRTDSLNLSEFSLFSAKKFIIENYGNNYWTGIKKYKTKAKGAQEAHEAIRPAYPEKTFSKLKIQEKLDEKSLKLYDLIWKRFIASQMSQAIFDNTSIDISAKNYLFKTTGQTLKFDGFLKVYPLKFEEKELPNLEKEEILKLIKIIPLKHFTQPPPRFNEASLIKILEENGIGRPSTYAPIISTIQERNYVKKDEQKRFYPTEIGILVNDVLTKHFPEIVDIKFTAKMEENLDKIAQGKIDWRKVCKDFYIPFEKNLEEKYKEVSKKEISETPTNEKCPKCSSPIIIKMGKFGKFYACSNFPNCKYTKPLKENISLNIICPKCNKGEIIEKRTKKGKIFYACNNWPKCDFALWDKPINKKCPKCSSLLIEKRGTIFCSNKDCQNSKFMAK